MNKTKSLKKWVIAVVLLIVFLGACQVMFNSYAKPTVRKDIKNPIYTIGDENYAAALQSGKNVIKFGAAPLGIYAGGLAFPSQQAAMRYLEKTGNQKQGWHVYQLSGDFEQDTYSKAGQRYLNKSLLVIPSNHALSSSTKNSVDVRSGSLSGILILGHEVSAITPCDSQLDYWVVDKTSSLKHNYEKIIGENPKPYTPVYLSAEVNFLGKASDGFAEEYDGVVEITKIDALSALTVAQNCNPEKTINLLQNNEVINATYINSEGEKLFVLFYTKEDQAVVRFVDNKASATLMSQRPASGMWYKNDEYELSGKGKAIELYKQGELLFKGQQLEK